MIMTSKGGFGCGILSSILWVSAAMLLIHLPDKSEDFWHGFAYVVALCSLSLGGIVSAVIATEADPPK